MLGFADMFKPKSGPMMLLESLLPPEIWAGIQKAANDIPQIVTSIQQTMVSVDSRLKAIQDTQDVILMRLDQMEMAIAPEKAQSITAMTLLDERVQSNAFSEEDVDIMRNARLTDEDIEMLDKNPPKILN